MQKLLMVLVLAVALGSAGCASKKPKAPPPQQQSSESSGGGAGSEGDNSANANAGSEDETAGPQAGLLAKRVIYFDFDSSEIKSEGTEVVAAHAKYLASHSSARVRLEGNTDDRGSREYNIGLGERRAQAVRRALLLQGATEAQLQTVSYGAERPAAVGNDEAAWAKNRRVEIVYLNPNAQPQR